MAKMVVYTQLPDYDGMLFLCRFLRPGDVFVDVGANNGLYALLAAERGASVVAFEPNPTDFDRLQANFALNRLSVQAIRAAVGAAEGEVRMTSHLGPANHVSPNGPLTVTLTSLDATVETADLIKVDVEGFELSVLDGAANLLRGRAAWIVELNGLGRVFGVEDEAIIGRFRSAGYEPYHFDADSGQLRPFRDEVKKFIGVVGRNALFLRPEHSLRLSPTRTDDR
jgi:FkbM family methyltransferase